MAVTYPTTLDPSVGAGPTGAYTTTKTGATGTGDHGAAHTDISTGIVALETKVGINGSSDVNSHEYKLAHISYSSLIGIPASFTPSAHATTHQSGGSDPLALDTLAATTDITTLNASTSAHGLLRKLSGTATTYLDGTGAFSTPPGANYTASQSIALAANNFTLVNDVAAPGNNQLYGTGGTGTRAWLAVSSLSLAYTQLTAIPAYVPQAAGTTAQVWEGGGGGWVAISGLAVAYTSLTSVPASFNPSAHATTHKSGGSDLIALDTLGATTDITTLNSSTTAHGLLPKLSNVATQFLNGTGGWTVPPDTNTTYTGSQSVLLTATNFTLLNDVATPTNGQFYGYSGGARGWFTPVDTNTTYTGSQSITLTATNFTLTGDVASPTATQYYGTNAASTRGWYSVSALSIAYSQLTSIPTYVPSSAGTSAQVWSGTPGWTAISGLAVAYSSLTGVPASFTPSAHAATHKSGGADLIALDTLGATSDITTLNVSTTAHGLCPKAPNSASQVLLGTGLFGTLAYASLTGIPSTFTPSAHATTHQSGGSDALPLDTLAATTDITTLNSSTTAHGLLRKLSNVATQYLDGTGNWSAPPATVYTASQSILLTGSNFTLVGDVAAPGNNQLYGTGGTGTRGWQAVSALSIAYSQLTSLPTYVPSSAGTSAQVWSGTPGWTAISGLAVAYSSLTGVPATFAPSAHATSHITGGADVIANVSTSAAGLVPTAPNDSTKYLNGVGAWALPPTNTGPPGPAGQSSYTLSTASLTVPAVGATTTVTVQSATWANIGDFVSVAGAGGGGQSAVLQITAIAGNTLTLLNPPQAGTNPIASTSIAGLLNIVSGNLSDYVGGDNACHPIPNATRTTASFTMPFWGSNVTVAVADTSWMNGGMVLNVGVGAGMELMTVVAINSTISVTLNNFAGSTSSGTIASGTLVTFNSSGIAAVNVPGIVKALSGNATDFLGGDNACHALASSVRSTVGLATPSLTGLSPVLGNTGKNWLRDDGAWAIPSRYSGSDTTNSNAYAITVASDFSLVTGVVINFLVTTTNTGSPTLNVNATGAKNLCNRAAIQLSASELGPNKWHLAMYDGTQWNILSSVAKLSGAALSGNVTLECAGYDSIAVNCNTSTNFNLTLAHVAFGIPIAIKIYGSGAAVTYTIAITNPAGASVTVFMVTAMTNKSTGATSIMSFGSAVCGSGGNIFLTGALGTAGEAWFT